MYVWVTTQKEERNAAAAVSVYSIRMEWKREKKIKYNEKKEANRHWPPVRDGPSPIASPNKRPRTSDHDFFDNCTGGRPADAAATRCTYDTYLYTYNHGRTATMSVVGEAGPPTNGVSKGLRASNGGSPTHLFFRNKTEKNCRQ